MFDGLDPKTGISLVVIIVVVAAAYLAKRGLRLKQFKHRESEIEFTVDTRDTVLPKEHTTESPTSARVTLSMTRFSPVYEDQGSLQSLNGLGLGQREDCGHVSV